MKSRHITKTGNFHPTHNLCCVKRENFMAQVMCGTSRSQSYTQTTMNIIIKRQLNNKQRIANASQSLLCAG